VDGAFEYFRPLGKVLPAEEVRMSGAWSPKPQLRYASPAQLGTGEGPYVQTVDWRWEGTVACAAPLVGIAILVVEGHAYWVKSQIPVAQAAVSVMATGWAARPDSISFGGAFHGAYLPAVPVHIPDEPPASVVLGSAETRTGLLHVVARAGGATFGLVLLPGSAVKVGRNRLWHLREGFTAGLSPELCRMMTRGRSGRVDFRG